MIHVYEFYTTPSLVSKYKFEFEGPPSDFVTVTLVLGFFGRLPTYEFSTIYLMQTSETGKSDQLVYEHTGHPIICTIELELVQLFLSAAVS